MESAAGWSDNWAWGVPIIVLTVFAHGVVLVIIYRSVVGVVARRAPGRRSALMSAAILGATVLLVTVLHAAEAIVWGLAYLRLGALRDARSAMLYSLNAITSYGHDGLDLAPHWRLFGALEALNGVILFGLTTAFLFSVLQGLTPPAERKTPRPPA